jgi:hypothetical protein
VGLPVAPFEFVVTFLTLVTTDTVSGINHLVSRCPTQEEAIPMPQPAGGQNIEKAQ